MTLAAQNAPQTTSNSSAFAALRRLARSKLNERSERCQLCGLELPEEHFHLVEIAQGKLLCACQACAILFDSAEGSRYLRVPREVIRLPDDAITDQQWTALGIPIGLAFFFRSTPIGKSVCLYPSAGGAIEADLAASVWDGICAECPSLVNLAPDTTALLVNRIKEETREHLIVPIDDCYRLIGLVRTHWRGFSGGTAVGQELDRFFAALRDKSKPPR